MKAIFESGSDLFLATALSLFTFCFIFLGVQLNRFYHVVGFGFLVASVVYWVKVKKDKRGEL